MSCLRVGSPRSARFFERRPSSLLALMKCCTSRGTQRCSSSFWSRMILRTRRSWSSWSRIWKRLRQARLAPVTAQHAVREAVKGVRSRARRPACESSVSMRPRISAAALFVKVTAMRPCGETPCSRISQAARCVSTRVLPLPGAGEHEHRPDRRADGRALLVVQGGQEVVGGHGRADSTATKGTRPFTFHPRLRQRGRAPLGM